ncbi:unnamed protein product [Caenorhabditis auriculariae]|uniref:Uncharacterized protein n=1 Tax=Caenorhabditis auriculariae TaxID=2777116 RepID=A0A8S1I0B5_9PELO|nr:unnamed protein product [Caenorhabditis auriculariae]
MEDSKRAMKTMDKSIEGSVKEEVKGGSSMVSGIQQAKKAFFSLFEGVFRLKGGSEALPPVPCDPTSPNLPSSSIQKPKEDAPAGYEIEGSEAAHSGAFQKTEDKILSEITAAELTGKGKICYKWRGVVALRYSVYLSEGESGERDETIAQYEVNHV